MEIIANKIKILLIISLTILFYSCDKDNEESVSSKISDICQSELSIYYGKREYCTHEKIFEDLRECNLYQDYNYTDEELRESNVCMGLISSSCENVENTNSISEINGCPTFRDKPIKSKKKICAENYYFFCIHLESCNKELTDPCKEAKYIATNNQGKDAHIDFKEEILINYCHDTAEATIEDVCLSRYISCDNSTLETYLEDCRTN